MRIPDRLFGKIRGHMEAARSSRNFAYGVYRSENRAGTSLPGPLNPTTIIPHQAAFVNRQNKQKFEDFSILEFDTQVDRQFVIKLHVFTAVTAGHIMSGFCSNMGAVRTALFNLHPNHPPRRVLFHSHQSGNEDSHHPRPASSNRSYYQRRSNAFSPSFLSSVSLVSSPQPHLSHLASSMSVLQ